jgi:pyridoxamine 5'-phosphate oxidase
MSITTSNTNTDLGNLRLDYAQASLNEAEVSTDPFEQFSRWFEQAQKAQVPEPNAMTLATVYNDKPSARIVLLKGIDKGFCFYSNFESRKGQEMAANPHAALVFLWHSLERQIRIEGMVEKVEEAIADAYYASRPISSQLGAWVSPQSRVIGSREVLEERENELSKQFAGTPLKRPPHWGGYRIVPEMLEFWQGRTSRLHDRLRYTKTTKTTSASGWKIERLAP